MTPCLPHAFEIDVDGAVPVFFGLFGEGAPAPLDPCVIKRNIQPAKLFHRFLDKRKNIGGSRYVGLHQQAISACGSDQINGFLSFRFAPAGDHHFGACLGKKYSGITPNTGRPASDNRNFATQLQVFFSSGCAPRLRKCREVSIDRRARPGPRDADQRVPTVWDPSVWKTDVGYHVGATGELCVRRGRDG